MTAFPPTAWDGARCIGTICLGSPCSALPDTFILDPYPDDNGSAHGEDASSQTWYDLDSGLSAVCVEGTVVILNSDDSFRVNDENVIGLSLQDALGVLELGFDITDQGAVDIYECRSAGIELYVSDGIVVSVVLADYDLIDEPESPPGDL